MRNLLFVVMLLLSSSLFAEMTLSTIELHHRSAEEIIPILQPMVQSGGSITGSGYKLFIKTTPANLEQLQAMLASIDIAAKQLLVSVSMDRAVLQQNTHTSGRVVIQTNPSVSVGGKPGGSAGGEIQGQTGNINYDAHAIDRYETQRTPQVQQVRVTEGLWATIHVGQGIPFTTSIRNDDGSVTETTTYQAVANGFKVLPRVNGDNVTLTINPQAQSNQQTASGDYTTFEMSTTVTGKIGQWLVLGSVDEAQDASGRGVVYRTQHRSIEHNQVYVKVELVK